MLNKKTIRDISVSGKKVLVRCDFNVPLDKNNPDIITSDKRIKESLKTINYLIGAGAKTILCSHLGKTGQNKSLKPVAKKLSELLEKEVPLLKDIYSDETKNVIDNMQNRVPNNEVTPPNKRGNAPISNKDGKPIEIHHKDQEPLGPFDEMHPSDHRYGENYKKNHPNYNGKSKVDRTQFREWKREYWEQEWDNGRWND